MKDHQKLTNCEYNKPPTAARNVAEQPTHPNNSHIIEEVHDAPSNQPIYQAKR